MSILFFTICIDFFDTIFNYLITNDLIITQGLLMRNQKVYTDKLKKILTKDEFIQFKKDKFSLIDFGYKYVDEGDFKRAFKVFNIGIKLNGSDPDILNGIGVSLCELGRLNSSRLILIKTMKLYPEDAITLANIAGVYWKEENFDKAIYFYNQSIQIDPFVEETHINLINIYYERGDLFMSYISSLNFQKIFPNNEQAKEILNDVILDIGISFY